MYPTPRPSDDWLHGLASKLAVASVTSQGTIGGLLVSGFVSIADWLKKK